MKNLLQSIFILISLTGLAQNNSDYIVDFNNDTTYTNIKKQSDPKLAKNITIVKDSLEQKLGTHQITSFKIGNKVFNRTVISSPNSEEEAAIFAEVIVNGKLQLLKYHFTDYNGKSTFENYSYYIKKSDKRALKVESSKMYKTVPSYIGDYGILAEQVKHKIYSYKDLITIVNKYNKFSDKKSASNKEIATKISEPYNYEFSNKPKYGWENHFSFNYSIPAGSELMNKIDPFTFSPGWTFDVGTGLVIKDASDVSYKVGLKYFRKFYEFTYSDYVFDNTLNSYINIEQNEKVTANYFGSYLRLIFPTGEGFVGGGFDFSFSKSISNDVKLTENGSILSANNNIPETSFEAIGGNTSNQFDLVFTVGKEFELNTIVLKPNFDISIPFSPIVDLPNITPVTGDLTMSAVLMKFGLIVEFKL